MPKIRRKVSAVVNDFDKEIKRCEKLDRENQNIILASATTYGMPRLPKRQIHILTEGIFFSAIRAFECFIRDVFLLYCLEKKTRDGKKVNSYICPKSFVHAEKLLQTSMRYIDWNSPNLVITRSELYLKDGFPIKIPYTTYLPVLKEIRRIRNHIAHDSKESLTGYKKVIKNHFTTLPINIPTPGEFLLLREKSDPTKYKLLTYFEALKRIISDIT